MRTIRCDTCGKVFDIENLSTLVDMTNNVYDICPKCVAILLNHADNKKEPQTTTPKGFIAINDYAETGKGKITAYARIGEIAYIDHYCMKQEDVLEELKVKTIISFKNGNFLYSYETVDEIMAKIVEALNG